jgi:DNA polymerase-3 subunit delta'
MVTMSLPWTSNAAATFQMYVSQQRVPHALLVTGPSGCGKLDLARDISRQLLCLEARERGCGTCRSCALLGGGAHPDFREVTFEPHPKTGVLRDVITVDQVRALIEALYKTTTISSRNVAVIHPAERMNISAANAILKTLEEPVGSTVLILVAHDAGRLPATVRSRCQRLPVALPDRETSLRWLVDGGGIDEAEARQALAAAAGRPLEARTLVESGELEHYRAAMEALRQLRSGAASDGSAVAGMADFDQARLWTWLSLRSATILRQLAQAGDQGELAKDLSKLQLLADRNRVLVGTPVRKDLLLRDWLIQWKQLPARLPLDLNTQEA